MYYQSKLVCTDAMNKWCKKLTIKTLTEVNLVRHKKVFNELMKKVSFVINEFEPTYGYSN